MNDVVYVCYTLCVLATSPAKTIVARKRFLASWAHEYRWPAPRLLQAAGGGQPNLLIGL